MSKLFSIIVTVHNREKYIKDTLLSVVGQEYRPLELILVDNNSDDNSIAIAKEYLQQYSDKDLSVVYASETKVGACAARNKGALLATSDYMMFLDDDDTLSSFKVVSEIVKTADSSKADIIGFTARYKFNTQKKKLRYASFKNSIEEQVLHCVLATQCYAVKRSFFYKSEGWDERIMRWQDWNLGIRLFTLNPKIEWIKNPPLVNIRVHSDSITGCGYLHSYEALENSVLLTADFIKNSNVEKKNLILSYVYNRLLILAAHYYREGGKDEAKRTVALYYNVMNPSYLQTLVAKLIYLYTIVGGRGGGRLINLLKIMPK